MDDKVWTGHSPAEVADDGSGNEPILVTAEEKAAYEEILDLLLARERVDFSHYRQSTVLRRMSRRMALSKQPTFPEYLSFLRTSDEELSLLHQDLLLFFTEFFRDPQVFDGLKTDVLPALVKNRTVKNPIRVWVPGCSTGEEVYSLAITLYEFLEAHKLEVTAQFFGTDLVDSHISLARAAVYPEKIAKHVSSQRLQRFFDKTESGYRVIKRIREMCVFATQDITQDPPFPNIDLLSCRNLLIYFDSTFQDIVIPLFHFALKPTGYLLLGTSETLGRFSQFFSPTDKRNNVFVKRILANKPAYRFPVSSAAFSHKLRSQMDCTGRQKPDDFDHTSRRVDSILLERYAPPGVLVDSNMQIRQFRGQTAKYLDPTDGEASLKLSKMAGGSLMPDLYVAIEEVKRRRTAVQKRNISYTTSGMTSTIDVTVMPVEGNRENDLNFLVLFEESLQDEGVSLASSGPGTSAASKRDDELEQLRQELMATKEYLQTIIEEKDEVNQELWTANEEVQSTNEELQSVNEELEAAKEELESSNEELIALNEELHLKNTELTEANALSECTINASMDGILSFDHDFRIKIWNPAMERMWGVTRQGCLNTTIFECFPFLIDNGQQEIFKAVLRGESAVVENQLYINNKTGVQGYFEGRYSPLRDQDDRIIGGLAIIHDTTERKWAEEKLLESEERFKMVMHQSPAAIELYDAEGVLININKAYEKMWGVSASEVVLQKNIFEAPGMDVLLLPYVRRAFRGEHFVIPEYQIEQSGSGDDERGSRWLSTRIYPLTDSSGTIINLVVSHEDVTARKQAEEDLLKLHKLESIGTLAGGIAHDFNNILMGIFGNLTLVKNELEDGHAAHEHLEDALASMQRATRLTQQLLVFAKGGSPVKEGVSIADLVEDVVRFDLSGSNILPEFSIDKELWVADVDKRQIQEVFSNLTVNAKQAMEAGGRLRVTLANYLSKGEIPELRPGRYVQVSFADEGHGIKEKDLGLIFDPYFTTRKTGRGLGLATTYSILKKHEGAITVKTTMDAGTIFTLYLPVNSEVPGDSLMSSAGDSHFDYAGCRVLIMDDEPMICKVTTMFLQQEGYQVDSVADGEGAIKMYGEMQAAGTGYDAVIMDLTIPGGMGGLSAVKKILEIDPDARVIVSSGYAEDPVMANYADFGFRGVAPKPYSKKKLLEVVRRVLSAE